ncbi:MAG: CBS domain-containing protein [Alphaproteobacteria bacterium]|jgi:CBS domain-containing protein|nr:CBS domain-containing protein [Alphaproteobacteria bacterium]
MDAPRDVFRRFFAQHHPFDVLPAEAVERLLDHTSQIEVPTDGVIHEIGELPAHLYVVRNGAVDVVTPEGVVVEHRGMGEGVGARAILRGEASPNRAVAHRSATLLRIPRGLFTELVEAYPDFAAYYERLKALGARRPAAMSTEPGEAVISSPLREVMTADPVVVAPDATVRDAATWMRDRRISCVLVEDGGRLVGIVTTNDLARRVVAAGRGADVPVREVMSAEPAALPPDTLFFDAMLVMSERDIGHLPVVEQGRAVGIVTRTNMIRRQSTSSVFMIGDIAKREHLDELAAIIGQLPQLLVQLVGAGVTPKRVGQVVTSVADALTRRLLQLAEVQLGPPPVDYLWLVCGSQGRQEQTGISDQDNCLILADDYDATAHGEYFERLARYVCDGLDACGYYYCPGEMMATNDQWRQPLQVWRGYFQRWIAKPDPKAQMLASVMFDLRPVAGDLRLFEGLKHETVQAARKNSIFRAHLVANSLGHQPPLSLLRGFALIRSGEHKDKVDLKLNGVVPIVDLARVYGLDAGREEVNTRDRILAAKEAGSLSASGADDLADAYDTIARVRLEHQAKQVRRGEKPDNFMAPSSLSALERGHLRDAFGVVKSLQAALAHYRSAT